MTERTFTEDEIREAIRRVTTSHGLMDELMTELTRPKPPVIPKGVLCWGVTERYSYYPCRSLGDGRGDDHRGEIFETIRLTHPDDWAKAPGWANSRAINIDGDIGWYSLPAHVIAEVASYIYAEGRPND